MVHSRLPVAVQGLALEQIVESIGPEVRDLRAQQTLSLQQLAARAGVPAAAIHKVERGGMVPTITTLLKLASALGRPIGYFVDDIQQPPSPCTPPPPPETRPMPISPAPQHSSPWTAGSP